MNDLERTALFWSHVDKAGPSTCWLWTLGHSPKGYGLFWRNGRMERTHRVSWELANGTIPHGMCVLHSCDVRSCVNPEHLFLGTNTDNVADMVSKGRQAIGDSHGARVHPECLARGSRHGTAKLRQYEIPVIRILLSSGISMMDVANNFGVSERAVHLLKHGATWKHVPIDPADRRGPTGTSQRAQE